MKTKLFLAGFALIAIASIANGQNTETGNRQVNTSGKGVSYVDENKNGICDNFENNSGTTQSTQGRCYYWRVKGNGNGQGNCCGRSNVAAQGRGKGKNFVDKDNNGVCDNFESRDQK
jgi:hypothetical protein